MFGKRRRVREEREKAISEERLFTLVNEALLRNFGPLGSYAVTMRSGADCDDVFHTLLAQSIAKNVTKELAESNLILVAAPMSLAPTPAVPVKTQLAEAVGEALEATPTTAIEIVRVPVLTGERAAQIFVSAASAVEVDGGSVTDTEITRALVA